MTSNISVIIPVHNGEKYILEAIKSVLQQEETDLYEILVIDDGSTDATEEIIAHCREPVSYYYQENKGVGSARNRGAALAKGKYLAFLDADDLWDKKKLQKQTALLESRKADMAFTLVQHFDCPMKQGNWTQSPAPMPGKFASTLLIARAAFLKSGGFPETRQIGEFVDWYSRAHTQGLQEVLVPEVLAYRRIHGGNMTVLQRAAFTDYASVLKAHLNRTRRER